jgi:hypothetical protein
VPSCASTCAALPLEQMVNLLEEYESAKGVPGSLESFDLRGTEGSKPPSSSGESCKPSVPRDRDRSITVYRDLSSPQPNLSPGIIRQGGDHRVAPENELRPGRLR